MNAIVCVVLLFMTVDTFCPFCESTLARGPSDKLILLGDSVTLECFSTDKKYSPTWNHLRVGSTAPNYVSLTDKRNADGVVVAKLVNGYHERYKLISESDTGDYSLQITNVQPGDAGTYTCTAKGGMGQPASATLTVLETLPNCTSNATKVLGENSCKQEPDIVAFSCRFMVHGSVMPMVTWVNVNNPEKVIKIDTPITDDDGYASSKLFLRGDHSGLNTASFQCILPSSEDANSERFTCKTPTIKVVEISNSTEQKTFTKPDEVECDVDPNLEMAQCEWVRRGDDDNEKDVVVSNKPLLNLHKSDMPPGIYVCIAQCNIRGRTVPCNVEALTIIYQPEGAVHGGWGASSSTFVIPVVVAISLIILVTIGIVVVAWRCMKRRNRRGNQVRIGPNIPTNGNVPNGMRDGVIERRSIEMHSLLPTETNEPTASGSTPNGEDNSDSGRGSSEPLNNSIRGSTNGPASRSIALDIPDAKIGKPGSREERLRLIEERAQARMRANAAARRGETNEGFSPDPANSDVAEGVSADPKKNE